MFGALGKAAKKPTTAQLKAAQKKAFDAYSKAKSTHDAIASKLFANKLKYPQLSQAFESAFVAQENAFNTDYASAQGFDLATTDWGAVEKKGLEWLDFYAKTLDKINAYLKLVEEGGLVPGAVLPQAPQTPPTPAGPVAPIIPPGGSITVNLAPEDEGLSSKTPLIVGGIVALAVIVVLMRRRG